MTRRGKISNKQKVIKSKNQFLYRMNNWWEYIDSHPAYRAYEARYSVDEPETLKQDIEGRI